MKKELTFIAVLLMAWGCSYAQLATFDAGANSALSTLNTAITKSNSVQGSMNGFLNKSFTTLGDMKAKATDLLKLTKEYQDALSAVNSVITNSQQVQSLFDLQRTSVKLYTDNVYRYDRYLTKKLADDYHETMRFGLAKCFSVLRGSDIILKSDFLKMNDNERFSQLSKINDEMYKLVDGMQAYINVYSRYAEILRKNPKAAIEANKQFGN